MEEHSKSTIMEEKITKREFIVGALLAIGLILLCGIAESIIR